MSRENDIKNIRASIFAYLNTNFTGFAIHWPGTEGDEADETWAEPFIKLTGLPARARDYLYTMDFSVNLFAKKSADTFKLDEMSGLLTKLFKAANIPILDYVMPGDPQIACAKFKESESTDLGETTASKGGAKGRVLRQYAWRIVANIMPVGIATTTTTTTL